VSVSSVSSDDLVWLVSLLMSKEKRPRVGGEKAHLDTNDMTLFGKNTPLFAVLCQSNPLWEATWKKTRPLEGSAGDQSDSAYELSLARIAIATGVDDDQVYGILLGWRREHHLPAKHHKALVLTIEKAHKAHVETVQEQQLDNPEVLALPERLTIVCKLVHLPIVRLVQMGRGEAHYRAHLASGVVLDFGNYAGFKSSDKWEQYVWEYAGKHLFTEKKRWAKICRLLLTLCDVEETEEMSSAAETHAWVMDYLSDLMHHPATVDTLKHASPFVDATGQYLQLDAFRSHARIHCQTPPISRSGMMGRLRVLGWAEVKLTRSDDKHTITRNYWHKVP